MKLSYVKVHTIHIVLCFAPTLLHTDFYSLGQSERYARLVLRLRGGCLEVEKPEVLNPITGKFFHIADLNMAGS